MVLMANTASNDLLRIKAPSIQKSLNRELSLFNVTLQIWLPTTDVLGSRNNVEVDQKVDFSCEDLQNF